MSAIPLFAKAEVSRKVDVPQRVTEAQQLAEWIKRGEDGVFSVVTLLTPEMAKLLMEMNDGNRPMKWAGGVRSVQAYADAMRRGEWRLNGEAIIISRCGKLVDGQHRTAGVIEADVPVTAQLVFGVEFDTRHTVDQGIARSPGHILSMRDEANANVLASALQFLWAMDEGISLNHRPSTDQLLAALERHPAIREAIPAANKLFAHYRLSSGYISAAHYLCRRHGTFSADQFLAAVTTGLNITDKNSPVLRLRKQFEEHGAKRKSLGRIEQAALYIKGYNNFNRGRTGPISWRDTGPAAEAFPTVGG